MLTHSVEDEGVNQDYYKQEIQKFFFEKNRNNHSNINYNYYHAICFLKKILIYMLVLMKLVNNFLDMKTKSVEINPTNYSLTSLIIRANENLTEVMFSQLPVDKKYMSLSIENLISLFDIRDFASYLTLSHTYIPKKKKQIKMTIIHKNKKFKFDYSIKEQVNLLCCKTKRKDELIKFSFKFIRRQVLKQFQEENKYKLDKSDRNKMKNIFYSKYLNENKEAIQYFESFDLSRKGLKVLSNYVQLKKMMIQFCNNFYIESMLNEYIYRKSDQIFHEDLNFMGFLTEVLSRQHKHSVIVQGVINSLEQFIEFFKI